MCEVRAQNVSSNFHSKPVQATGIALTFRIQSDSVECKSSRVLKKIDRLHATPSKLIQHRLKRPESGHSLPVQSSPFSKATHRLWVSKNLNCLMKSCFKIGKWRSSYIDNGVKWWKHLHLNLTSQNSKQGDWCDQKKQSSVVKIWFF